MRNRITGIPKEKLKMMINFRIHFEIYSGNIYSTADPENFEISESVFLDLQERASNHLMA